MHRKSMADIDCWTGIVFTKLFPTVTGILTIRQYYARKGLKWQRKPAPFHRSRYFHRRWRFCIETDGAMTDEIKRLWFWWWCCGGWWWWWRWWWWWWWWWWWCQRCLDQLQYFGRSSRHWRESKKVNSRVEREILNSDLESRKRNKQIIFFESRNRNFQE